MTWDFALKMIAGFCIAGAIPALLARFVVSRNPRLLYPTQPSVEFSSGIYIGSTVATGTEVVLPAGGHVVIRNAQISKEHAQILSTVEESRRAIERAQRDLLKEFEVVEERQRASEQEA